MTDISDNDKVCDVNLYAEINQLKEALAENNSQLLAMETACLRESDRHVELEDSLIAWQDKYERLQESHKRVQKNNQSLEEKLLKLVDQNAGERAQLTSDVATLSVRLAQANYNIGTLQKEIERYKTDMSLAIQLLQCKPDSFVSQKVASLPQEIQTKVSQYARLDTHSHSDSEGSTSGVGISTDNAYHILPASDSPVSTCPFTSTSLVYGNGTASANGQMAANNCNEQMISPLGMAKYLDDKLKASEIKHCETCLCAKRDLRVLADIDQTYSVGTQTILQGDANYSLCLRCNSNLNSPSSANSPFLMKLVKSTDSILSETKSSFSCNGSTEKLLGKKDELTVNPILGHNTLLSDRSKKGTIKLSEHIKSNVTDNNHSKLTPSANDLIKDSIYSQQQLNRSTTAGSANSLSSRNSANNNLDGSKIFESFNRNLIKSIKAEKPNVSGPRLCALRIPNGSTNILLDNIESESTPVIYTRRSRFLDEELDENKDIITNHKYPINSNGDDVIRKISMLMTDGIANIATNTDAPMTDGTKICNIYPDNINGIAIDTNVATGDKHELMNRKCTANTQTILNEKSVDFAMARDSQLVQCDNVYLSDVIAQSANLNVELQQQQQHQQQQQQQQQQYQQISYDETSFLRRQQLNRVAEWVQNNSTIEEPIPNYDDVLSNHSDYKPNKINNSIDINNCSIDSKLKSLTTINTINNNSRIDLSSIDSLNVDISNIDFAQRPIAIYNDINNLNNNNHLNSTQSHVDLAQMEYNVKQFLLKQNEWSNTPSPLRGQNNVNTTTNAIQNGNLINGRSSTDSLSVSQPSSNNISYKNPHRTETNL